MTPAARARIIKVERKAFRAAKLPRMPAIDRAGVSTKPWGARGIRGIGFGGPPSGPSRTALRSWERATGQATQPRRRARRILGIRI